MRHEVAEIPKAPYIPVNVCTILYDTVNGVLYNRRSKMNLGSNDVA